MAYLGVTATVLAAMATPAQAQVWSDPWGGSWSGAAGVVSDKVFRGISQTRGRATVLLDLNRRSDTGWTFGLGAAPLHRSGDPEETSSAELTASVGRGWQVDGNWAIQLGLAHYAYPGRGRRTPDYNYDEVSASLGWQGRLFVSAMVSPNTEGRDGARGLHTGPTSTLELSARQRLIGSLALDAGIGYYDLSAVRGTGYRYGSIGLSGGYGPVQLYLTRIASNAAGRGLASSDVAGRRWVGSALWNF